MFPPVSSEDSSKRLLFDGIVMESIVTIDIGSTSMRAVHHDTSGRVLHKCRRGTIPCYLEDKRVELDCNTFIDTLLSLLKESYEYAKNQKIEILAISVTSQRSSVVPVDGKGKPLAPFIMWHDKRTVPICKELEQHQQRVYELTGLRIIPVLSAAKMTWIRRELPEVYKKTAKMLGIQDVAIHTLCGEFVTDNSLASNTTLQNLHTLQWDDELLELFEVERRHLCDLIPPGSICGTTSAALEKSTGIPQGIKVVSAGGDQQCAALGLGIISEGKVKCTTGTGSYLIAHSNSPILDEQSRFLCKVGAIPGSYNLEAGMLTTGTVYRWFIEQFYPRNQVVENIEQVNQEVLSSPPGANGVLLLPHFEGSGAPHWDAEDCGVFYRMKLSTTRADMARAVLEGIVMEMAGNIDLFKKQLGRISEVCVSGGMTKFSAYNQLQADIYASDVVLHANRESTSLGAWISGAVAIGLSASYEEALQTVQPPGSETRFSPDSQMTELYQQLNIERTRLYESMQRVKHME